MGDGVTDDKDLVITFGYTGGNGEAKAGGKSGQLILSDVTLTAERDNTNYSGIGNDEPIALGYGDKTLSFSTEAIVNQRAADMMIHLYRNDKSPADVAMRDQGNVEANGGKLDWNNLEWSATDDGDVAMSIDADIRDFSWAEK